MVPYQPAPFPLARPRRLRTSPWVRRLVAETVLTPFERKYLASGHALYCVRVTLA